MKTLFYKNFGFWGLALLVVSYVYGYFAGMPKSPDVYAANNSNFIAVGLLYLAGIVLGLIGLWKHPKQRVWSFIAIGLVMLVALLANFGTK